MKCAHTHHDTNLHTLMAPPIPLPLAAPPPLPLPHPPRAEEKLSGSDCMRSNEMMVTSFDSFVPPTACVAAGWIPALLFKRPRVRRDTFQTECLVDFFFLLFFFSHGFGRV